MFFVVSVFSHSSNYFDLDRMSNEQSAIQSNPLTCNNAHTDSVYTITFSKCQHN